MRNESRIEELLEKLFDSNSTPEVICARDPELLDEVRTRWRLMRQVTDRIDDLFPTDRPANRDDCDAVQAENELPRIDGYDVEAILGRGGMGVVFKARHHKLNRFVAIKMMRAGSYADPTQRARFRREAEAVAAIRHPNIVEIHDVGDSPGSQYFTMELLEGRSLAEKLAGKPQPARQAAELIATLASAVQFAHQSGFIHRDLKPSNILFTVGGFPKIADFGLVRPIQSGPEYTFSGARIGTPSYMAPEQAQGQTHAIGPAVDIYALGVVLYEMLTGRPPFAAESAAELERQVVGKEPPPPSRLNAKVPRDLETICLKCLEKNPARRYASAQDLADDLHRFLDGRPVLARPVGLVERMLKWARRRPALAVLVGAVLALLGTAVGAGAWLQRERSSRQAVTRGLIANEIPRVYEFAQENWRDAARILTDVQNNLDFSDSAELSGRAARAIADLRFAEQLERIRQRHMFTAMEDQSRWSTNDRECAKEYAEAFARAQIDVDSAESTVATIRASEVRAQVLTALDLWALVALDENLGSSHSQLSRIAGIDLQALFVPDKSRDSLPRKLLHIAKMADPDPAWRDRFRDPDVWRDRQRLIKLAGDAAKAEPPAHQLAIVGMLLFSFNARADRARLMRDALRRRPEDFWLNWELGDALYRDTKYQEAVTYFRIALALRPKNPWTLDRLSLALAAAGQFDEAVADSRRAVDLEPSSAMLRYNFAVSLLNLKRFDEARKECERILETDPKDRFAYLGLAGTYMLSGRHAESIPIYRRLIEIDPNIALAWYYLGLNLLDLERFDEAAPAFARAVRLDTTHLPAHVGLARVSLRLGKYETAASEFQWIIRRLDRDKTTVLADYAMDPDGLYGEAWPALAESLSCLGRFAAARDAAERAVDLPGMDESRRGDARRQLARYSRLAAVEPRLPAILAGKDLPTDVATRIELARWLQKDRRRPYAAARLYESAFAVQPSLVGDLESGNRFMAACAAALAGCGLGEDAAKLDGAVKAELRRQALGWLKADRDAHGRVLKSGTIFEQYSAARALAAWRQNKELACLRDRDELARLPATEAKTWQGLWSEIDVLVADDPMDTLLQAQGYAWGKQWTKAAEAYARLMPRVPLYDTEVWYEYAAVQLLAGDARGYRATCRRMLAPPPGARKPRPYLVARACTLAADSADDVALAMKLCDEELTRSRSRFWSLTQRGALSCRAQRRREALPMFCRSLQAEAKRGCAVVNWLWLAIAHQELGERDEAHRWLDQSTAWLDSLRNPQAASGAELALHLHNWLEANVLRAEVERTLVSFGERK